MILFKKRLLFSMLLVVGFACSKKDNTIQTTALAEFAWDGNGIIPAPAVGQPAVGSYYIANDPNSVYKIPIGITTVSSVDRTINFTVSSSTGAASGVQYTIASNSIIIPAGKVVDSIPVKGIFAGYPTGRKDTLTFTITGGDVPNFPGYDVFKLVLQKYCAVNPSDFIGNFTKATDAQSPNTYGYYTANVVSATSNGPTSATLVIKNLAAAYFGPFVSTDATSNPGISVKIDWSNPANFTTTIVAQPLYKDPTYGAATITGVNSGSFSSCDNTITLSYKVTVAAGSFGNFITTLKR